MKYTSILIFTLFSILINFSLSAKNLPIPGCSEPDNISVSKTTSDTIVLDWTMNPNELPKSVEIRYRAIKPNYDSYVWNTIDIIPREHNQYTISNLVGATTYEIQLRSKCYISNNEFGDSLYIYSDWKVIFHNTLDYISSWCNTPTEFNIENIDYKSFDIKWSKDWKLGMCSRRFIVKYKQVGSQNEQFHIIYSDNSNRITKLFDNTEYEIYIKEALDKCGMEYSLGCPWVGPYFIKTKSLANFCQILNPNVFCVSSNQIIVKFSSLYSLISMTNPLMDKDTRVKLRYRNVGINDWTEIVVYKGSQWAIKNLASGQSYEIEIGLIKGDGTTLYCPYTNLGVFQTLNSPGADLDGDGIEDVCDENIHDGPLAIVQDPVERNNNLPNLQCGQNVDMSSGGTQPLISLLVGDIIYIRGFPIKITEVYITGGPQGEYKIRGIMSLPFNSIKIKVQSQKISVNTEYKVWDGEVVGELDGAVSFPDFEIGYLSNGNFDLNGYPIKDKFCEPPSDDDDWDENGINKKTGKPWDDKGYNKNKEYVKDPLCEECKTPGYNTNKNTDPNGFNADGININTGTKVDQFGCTQEAYNDPNSDCYKNRPPGYCWLNNNCPGNNTNSKPKTKEGQQYLTEMQDSIRPYIIKGLGNIKTSYSLLANSKNDSCNQIRTRMTSYVQALKFDSVFIFGPNNEWFKPGMYTKFESEPKPLGISLDRDIKEELLENDHIYLYYCDKKYTFYNEVASQAQKKKDNAIDVDQIVLYIKELIQQLTKEEVDEMKKNKTFQPWVTENVLQYILDRYIDSKLLSSNLNKNDTYPKKLQFNHNEFDIVSNHIASTSNEDNRLKKLNQNELKNSILKDIDYQIQQGFSNINGIELEYYLEEIERQKSLLPPSSDGEQLPISMKKIVAGLQCAISLYNVRVTPQKATLNAFTILSVPPSKKRLVFSARDLEFTPSGLPLVKLFLAQKVDIAINNVARINIKSSNNTFVQFDCEGFAGISVDADIEFCRKHLTPLDSSTLNVITDENVLVKANFVTQMPAWGEFVAQLNMTPFAITKHEEYKWRVNNVVLDFSDSNTPSNVIFPPNYNSGLSFNNNGITTPLACWKGVYIGSASVTFPGKFMSSESKSKTTIGVQKVIIDDGGVTGSGFITPVIPLDSGTIDGWAFSIDTFKLGILRNNFRDVSLMGKIHVPIVNNGTDSTKVDPSECFSYVGKIGKGGKYSLNVRLDSAIVFPINMLKAQAKFQANSFINITSDGTNFDIVANLTGEFSSNAKKGSLSIKVPKVSFQNLILRNRAPYFDVGTWSAAGDIGATLGPFEFNIANIGMNKVENEPLKSYLRANISLGMTNKTDKNAVSASGGFRFYGNLVTINGRQKWAFDYIGIEGVSIDASFAGVNRIKGSLFFYDNDPEYGDGFYGGLTMNLKSINVDIAAAATFGTVNNFKYFYVDALAKFTPGIGGALKLQGFGGGIYYHMTRGVGYENGLPSNIDPNKQATGPGVSLSNIKYVPDINSGIGIKATVVLALAKKEAFSGNVTLEIKFNSSTAGGGLSDIWFYGNGRFMTPMNFSAIPAITNDVQNAAISASVDIHYDNNRRVLDGKLGVKINAAKGLITGGGQADFSFGDTCGWYINIGTPSTPINLKAKLLIETEMSSYFDIGNQIPAMPELPANVKSLTGLGSFMAQESSRRTGKGFAFGSHMKIGFNKTLWKFYGSFSAGAGFDVMVQDYGDATCANLNNEKLGINGWYASGQVYAFIEAAIGIEAWGSKYDIMSLAVAAALQAKMPNPFWMKGAVGGRYRILGGLIKGSCKFDFEIGESCQISGAVDPNANEPIINDIIPGSKLENISTKVNPEITFNVPIGKVIKAADVNGIERTYTSEIVNYKVKTKSNINIFAKQELSDEGVSLKLVPSEMLPPNDTIIVSVTAVTKKDYQIVKTETKSDTFYTDATLEVIPFDNIIAAYPRHGQYNFYKNEYFEGKGYIYLVSGQASLLSKPPVGYKSYVIFKRDGITEETRVPFTYNPNDRKIEYPIPSTLQKGKEYTVQIVHSKITAGTRSTQSNNNILYEFNMRVSLYDRFYDKIQALNSNVVKNLKFGYNPNIPEVFDDYELYGNGNQEPFIDLIDDTDDPSSWLSNLYNILYKENILNVKTLNNPYGYSLSLSSLTNKGDSRIFNNSSIPTLKGNGLFNYSGVNQNIIYNLLQIIKDDYNEAKNFFVASKEEDQSYCIDLYGTEKNKCMSSFENGLKSSLGEEAKKILNNEFSFPPAGTEYSIFIKYTLPYTNKTTSSTRIKLKY